MTAIATTNKPLAATTNSLSPSQWGTHSLIPISDRLALLGRVKIGRKGEPKSSKNGGTHQLPQRLDHFLITTNHRGADGNFVLDLPLMDEIARLPGYADNDGKLRRLPISLVSNDINLIFRRRYVWYIGKKRAGESDGRKLTLWYDPLKKTPLAAPRVYDWIDPEAVSRGEVDADAMHADIAHLVNVEKVFRKYMTFSFTIRGMESRLGGVYGLSTVSEINWDQLPSSVAAISRETFGFVKNLPMDLVITPRSVSPVVNGEAVPSTVYVLHVEMKVKTVQAIRDLVFENTTREMADLTRMKQLERQYRQLVLQSSLDEPAEDLPQLPPRTESQTQSLAEGEVPTQTPEEDAIHAMNAASTLEELAKVFTNLSPQLQRKVKEHKDKRKAELTPTSVVPVTETQRQFDQVAEQATGQRPAAREDESYSGDFAALFGNATPRGMLPD